MTYLRFKVKIELMNLPKLFLAAIFFSISTHVWAQDCLSGLPESLRSTVEQGNWKIVQPGDVPQDDWKLWKNTHQGQCPGVAVGNFFPKADSSFVVALIQQSDQKTMLEQVLLVTLKKDQPGTAVVVPPTQVATPSVVWKLPPGRYAGVDGTRASISRDSFVFEKVASSAKQFYYQGSHLQSFIISN
jgi:hypothetical protein